MDTNNQYHIKKEILELIRNRYEKYVDAIRNLENKSIAYITVISLIITISPLFAYISNLVNINLSNVSYLVNLYIIYMIMIIILSAGASISIIIALEKVKVFTPKIRLDDKSDLNTIDLNILNAIVEDTISSYTLHFDTIKKVYEKKNFLYKVLQIIVLAAILLLASMIIIHTLIILG